MIASLLLIAAPAAMVQGKATPVKTYSSCAALRKDFPKGVAYSSYTVGTSGAKVTWLSTTQTTRNWTNFPMMV